jgi:hypothetical protein
MSIMPVPDMPQNEEVAAMRGWPPKRENRLDYSWLRNKSFAHLEKLREKMLGKQNAKKHGLYSGTPPATVCAKCPNTFTCPYYEKGNVCHFVWEKVFKMEKDQNRYWDKKIRASHLSNGQANDQNKAQ